MKFITVVIGVLLCLTVLADREPEPGYERVRPADVKNNKRVFIEGSKAALKTALLDGAIKAANYHIDKLHWLDKKEEEGQTRFELCVEVTDNDDETNTGKVEASLVHDLATDNLILKGYKAMDFPGYATHEMN